MKHSRTPSTINAGSMADIAFLLLLFFLVATTISQEKGIIRKLPDACPTNDCTANVAERNMLRIHLNEAGALMVNNEQLDISKLRETIRDFVDNNGNSNCDYCNGEKLQSASAHPSKAVVSLSSHRLVPYGTYISVQDEITAAYSELRSRYAEITFEKSLDNLSSSEMENVKRAYPFIVSEATLQ